MLSAPVKSAKRISSLFSLGSASSNNKDSDSHPHHSPVLSKPPPADHFTRDGRQSFSRPGPTARHVSAPHLDGPDRRSYMSPGMEDFSFDLPPPPSLLSVNQDLADSAPGSPDGRPQSRGRRLSVARPASSGGLFVPGSGPDSRPSTPSKRRSWIPGRARASSMDNRFAPNSPPPLPGAWIAGLDQKVVYDLGPLARGEQVCLSSGDLIFLFFFLFSPVRGI